LWPFTPTGACWLNLVWLAHLNEDPRLFIWIKTTDQILETVAG
jgi:hypothetical protein